MTPAEHFAWAQARALEYVELGEAGNAMASFVSDLNKHEGTADLLNDGLRDLFVVEIVLDGAAGARRFIEGLRGPTTDQPGRDTT